MIRRLHLRVSGDVVVVLVPVVDMLTTTLDLLTVSVEVEAGAVGLFCCTRTVFVVAEGW